MPDKDHEAKPAEVHDAHQEQRVAEMEAKAAETAAAQKHEH